MTPQTSGKVSEDSAIVVAITMWQIFGGGFSITNSWSSAGICECNPKSRYPVGLPPGRISSPEGADDDDAVGMGAVPSAEGLTLKSSGLNASKSSSDHCSNNSGFGGTFPMFSEPTMGKLQYNLLCSRARSPMPGMKIKMVEPPSATVGIISSVTASMPLSTRAKAPAPMPKTPLWADAALIAKSCGKVAPPGALPSAMSSRKRTSTGKSRLPTSSNGTKPSSDCSSSPSGCFSFSSSCTSSCAFGGTAAPKP
mmetsp:Transcript_28929/g.96311  ORF Transcript_28929/g.96311 Transcript_28929/m.96311 type:complete len:253 (+) Transcript_28929:4091-4849(+)